MRIRVGANELLTHSIATKIHRTEIFVENSPEMQCNVLERDTSTARNIGYRRSAGCVIHPLHQHCQQLIHRFHVLLFFDQLFFFLTSRFVSVTNTPVCRLYASEKNLFTHSIRTGGKHSNNCVVVATVSTEIQTTKKGIKSSKLSVCPPHYPRATHSCFFCGSWCAMPMGSTSLGKINKTKQKRPQHVISASITSQLPEATRVL
ncbi:hypothetical protein V8F20_009380 [Naviculisporaceae sp. PSN 640]